VTEKSIMKQVADSIQMVSKQDVHQFWVQSTRDFFSDAETGIDISHRQDNYWKFLDLWEKEIILRNLPVGLILDLGAGTGRITNFLRSHKVKVISVDFVYECLGAIKGTLLEAPRANMDVTALGLKDSSMDCVVSCRVLQSLPTYKEKELAVKEIARVLKKGGSLILTEGNPIRTRFVPVPYNFYIKINEWCEMLKMHGLMVTKIYGIPFLTALKVLDKISYGYSDHLSILYRLANFLDHRFTSSFLKHLSLQFDVIAVKI
jgi:ubiquinone/menaquinone biosynthesis C-methylase UbiE